jgi:pimeloyl-ACP methyl ester carboxylesterase
VTFTPHYVLLTAPGAAPSRWMFVLHGIFGSGGNFRTFAKRLAAAAPDWGFVLVDLRMHGQSQGAPAPHTLAAAADDLLRLESALARPIAGVMGHSFGGKVAMTFVQRRPTPLDCAIVLDASPSAHPDRARESSTRGVLDQLRAIPWPLASREDFFTLMRDAGYTRGLVEWLAMNVRSKTRDLRDGVELRLDLDAIGALLDDYFATDLWSVVEQPKVEQAFCVVIGGRSNVFDPADRARLAELAQRSPRLVVKVLESAGHWVHVDDPEGLFAAVAPLLVGSPAPHRDA